MIECLDRASGRLYGYRSDPHSHLTCLESGAIEDLDVELPDALLKEIERRTGYRIESYTLQLNGRPNCPWRNRLKAVTLTRIGAVQSHRERPGPGDSSIRSRAPR